MLPVSLPTAEDSLIVLAFAFSACRGVYDLAGDNGVVASGPPVAINMNQGADCRWIIEAAGALTHLCLDTPPSESP